MADNKKAGKGGGARKIGSNQAKCSVYQGRENAGNTVKTRRIARKIKAGVIQPGWILTEKGRAMRDPRARLHVVKGDQ